MYWDLPSFAFAIPCGQRVGAETCRSFIILIYACSLFRSPSLFYLLTVGVEVVYFHLITLRHTPQSVGLLWTSDRPVARPLLDNANTVQDKHYAPVGFEPTISASAWPQTYALDSAATGIGHSL
jgi:hypothetical protein